MKIIKPTIFLYFLIFFFACQSSPNSESSTTEIEYSVIESQSPISKQNFVSVRDSAYVSASSGLRVRNAPGLEGEKIGVRPFGKKVRIIERTGIPIVVKDNGKEITGEWVGIESRLLQDGKLEIVTGYVFDGFLVRNKENIEDAIPENIKIEKLQTVFNQNAGIGGLLTNPKKLTAANKENFEISLYGENQDTIIGRVSYEFFRKGNYRKYSDFKHPENCKYTDAPRMSASTELGLGNFLRVYDRKENFLFLGHICHQPVWINSSELDPETVIFQNYLDIFKSYPKGGVWKAGYSYSGANKVLRKKPKLNAKAVLKNILPDFEIFLLGEYQGTWAKVKVREAQHNFGEMYFTGTDYGNEWVGWIRIVDSNGTMLIAPHIFGC